MAFPELNKSELYSILKKNYISFGILIAEMMSVPYASQEEVCDKFDIDEAQIKNDFIDEKGIILYAAHFGNWELGGIAVGIVLNKPVFVLAKPQRNQYVTDWLRDMREKFGNKSVMLGASVRELYSLLKKGNIVGIVGDQRGPKEGMRVNFFGKETAVYTGTAEIGMKTKSKVMVTFAVRQKDYRYKLETEELVYDNPEGKESAVREFNQRYYEILEKYTRKYPEQWFWMHKIWKY